MAQECAAGTWKSRQSSNLYHKSIFSWKLLGFGLNVILKYSFIIFSLACVMLKVQGLNLGCSICQGSWWEVCGLQEGRSLSSRWISSVNSWLTKEHVWVRKCETLHRNLSILLPSRGSRAQQSALSGIYEPFVQTYMLTPQVRNRK